MADLHIGVAFSPQTTLSENIGAADTIIKVSDSSVFPDPPNYATIGTDELGETIEYAAKAEGLLSGCTRGVEGTAKAWQKGDVIARNFTAKDHNDMITAVTTAQQTANTAASAAETAQSSANNAKSAADNAQSTANAAKTTADAALPKSGGVMTGAISQSADGQTIIKSGFGTANCVRFFDDGNGNVNMRFDAAGTTYPGNDDEILVKGIKTPIHNTDAANKLYVDSSIVRQNLLDNACWISKKLIINQRNAISWKGGYGIDRWTNTENKNTAVISVEDSGIKLTSTVDGNSLGCVFSQRHVYNKTELNGKPVTVSVLAKIVSGSLSIGFSNDAHSDHTHYKHFSAENEVNLYSYTASFPESFNEDDIIRYAFYQIGSGETILYAAKAELGSTQTLAHQENGEWVLNEIPDYATELLKCQRYQYVFQGYINGTIGQGYATVPAGTFGSPDNLSFIHIPTPTTMRTKPTVTFSGSVTLSDTAYVRTEVTGMQVNALTQNCIDCTVYYSGTAKESGANLCLSLDVEDATVIFDSNL